MCARAYTSLDVCRVRRVCVPHRDGHTSLSLRRARRPRKESSRSSSDGWQRAREEGRSGNVVVCVSVSKVHTPLKHTSTKCTRLLWELRVRRLDGRQLELGHAREHRAHTRRLGDGGCRPPMARGCIVDDEVVEEDATAPPRGCQSPVYDASEDEAGVEGGVGSAAALLRRGPARSACEATSGALTDGAAPS